MNFKNVQEVTDYYLNRKVRAFGNFIVGLYNLTVCSLYFVIVPVECTSYGCSLYDVLFQSEMTLYKSIVVGLNLTTLAIYLLHKLCEFYREHICIQFLDINPEENSCHLRQEIAHHPHVRHRLNLVLGFYKRLSYVVFVLTFFNVTNSLILFIYLGYLNNKSTMLLFITNFIFLIQYLYNTYGLIRMPDRDCMVYSAYFAPNLIYNSVSITPQVLG